MYSFDTAFSPEGIYTSLTTFQSFGRAHVRSHFNRQGSPLYLRQKFRRVRKPETVASNDKDASANPTKLAIGVEGGFGIGSTQYDVVKRYSVVFFPSEEEFVYPSDQIPQSVADAVEAVLKKDGIETADANNMAWEFERNESKYARALEQVPATEEKRLVLSDPAKWMCEDSKTTTNLWLNLSTGHIGSGRKNWDGSGGTGASLNHFKSTGGIYPLVVKLGTITPEGADVYSYAPGEDDLVLDPLLKQHLAHWGIDMDKQEKTEKTMVELQIKLNSEYDFSKITESGSELVPIIGPGYVGLENLGNSCYMASVMQLMFAIPEVAQRYWGGSATLLETAPAADPSEDLLTMMAKLGVGILSKNYAQYKPLYEWASEEEKTKPGALPSVESARQEGDDAEASVRPFMFKRLIGKNHPDFSTAQQQDASEFYQHLVDKLAGAEYAGVRERLLSPGENVDDFVATSALFSYEIEERLECQQSHQTRYMTNSENMVSLPIPLEKATNTQLFKDYEERTIKRQKLEAENKLDKTMSEDDVPVKLNIPFEACLEAFCADQHISGFISPATSKAGDATKRTRFKTFPEYLVIQLKKYMVDPATGAPKKLDVLVPMPNEVDLTNLRATGPAAGEVQLPEGDAPAGPQADPTIVAQLMDMGFSENGSKRAALATNNSNVQAGMEWVFEHNGDPDFNDPIPVTAGTSAAPAASGPSAADLATLQGLGFTDKQARAALMASKGAVEPAANWLFGHMEDMDSAVDAVLANAAPAGDPVGKMHLDGGGKYGLVGFASHIGSNTACGHYVAHIRKEDQFVLFNDGKVAKSQSPPVDLGFLYLYKRL